MKDIDKIINQISDTRKGNNKNWMDILKLAVKYAPREAGFIIKDISECDQKINEEWNELIKELVQ